jgi:hypothetical protein
MWLVTLQRHLGRVLALPVLDQIVFSVPNFARSRQFYEAALAPPGYGVMADASFCLL